LKIIYIESLQEKPISLYIKPDTAIHNKELPLYLPDFTAEVRANIVIMVKITKQGNGKQPQKGDVVSVHYAGRLVNGQEFDNSFRRGEPIEIPIGVGQVIKGWDEGIMLLKEGDAATLLIPSELGYGARGAGGVIPPNAWLIFDVELVKVK